MECEYVFSNFHMRMINPYYYFFYKLSRFFNKEGDNEWGPIGAITFFIGQYIGISYIEFLSIGEEMFNRHKIPLIIIMVILFIGNSILFLNSIRVNRIMDKYQCESKFQNKLGTTLVIIFMLLPLIILLFF